MNQTVMALSEPPQLGQAAPAPLQLDRARMKKTASYLLVVLKSYLPTELMEWAEDNRRPDLGRYLTEAEEVLAAAVASADPAEFVAAINRSASLYRQVALVFEKDSGLARRLSYSGQKEQCFLGGPDEEQR